MNMIMLLILPLVLCAYFWPGSPKLLKDNKQILLGVVVGLIFCKYFKGDLVEGYWTYILTDDPNDACYDIFGEVIVVLSLI